MVMLVRVQRWDLLARLPLSLSRCPRVVVRALSLPQSSLVTRQLVSSSLWDGCFKDEYGMLVNWLFDFDFDFCMLHTENNNNKPIFF